MGLAKFKMFAAAIGRQSTVEVNGEELTQKMTIRSATVTATSDSEVTRLILEVYGEGEIEGEGIVEVRRVDMPDVRDLILDFLADLDPEELDVAVNRRLQVDAKPYAELLLDELKAQVRGDGS